MKRIWKSKSSSQGDIVSTLLANRAITGPESEKFFEPLYEMCHDPFLLMDMDKGAERIWKAVARNEKITIYGDYDADAVTAAAVLLRFFQKIGYKNADHYIPDRFSEGYGMNSEAVTLISERGTNLIITVDCGINATESIRFANSLGIDVIVTDHHQLTGELPQAAAVINPHRPGDTYPFQDLTGVGVAFKLVQALLNSPSPGLSTGSRPPSPASGRGAGGEGWEKWLLDLVAIGTVADCQSLLGENRILVKWGLRVLQKTRWPGLSKLLKQAGLLETALDTYHLGFLLAPRLNAAGRIEHANLALELLLTDDDTRAEDLSQQLNELNKRRQNLTEQILSEAREQLAVLSDEKILLAAGEGWPKGIVGLVAGKLTEEFSRPVLVLEKSGGEATGSARSIRNFNIVEAIQKSQDILVKYGGHPMAAGFTIKSEHIEIFYSQLREYAQNNLNPQDLEPILEYEMDISLAQVTGELVDALDRFAPFGAGNPRPRFRINNLVLSTVSTVGQDGQHLRLYVGSESGKMIQCIGFSLGFWAQKLGAGSPIDIICEPQWNEWNGVKKIQLKIIDINFSVS